jgi:NADH-quinone oxidoreductase subunit J
LETIVFYCFAVPVLMLALVVVTTKQILRAVVALFLALVGVAGLFFLLRAPVLAALQLMVYAGGIVVLFAFAVMLVRRVTGEYVRQSTRFAFPAAALGIGFAVLIVALWQGQITMVGESGADPESNVGVDVATRFVGGGGAIAAPPELDPKEGFSPLMLREYLLPFEIASVLMLVAMVGAILIARPSPHETSEERAAPPEESAEPVEERGEHDVV